MSGDLHFGPFRLDRANQSLWRGDQELALTPKAFAVLVHLADRSGKLVTKNELLDAVWGDTHVTDGALKRCVVEMRRVLEDSAEEPRYIQTLHGRGYRFQAATGARVSASDAPARRAPAIVGRLREFETLDASFERALEGLRQIVFITGEAGLGKTTLVDNWLRALAARIHGGAQTAVGRGRCLQQFGAGEAYLPVFEALEDLGRSMGPRLVGILRTHAPTWLLHMPSLISLQDHVRLREEVFGTTRERMLRELTGALDALSAANPIALLLEDLHWSDPSTIDLLTAIATRTGPAQLMVLATYRPAQVGGGHPLGRITHELEIHGQCRILPLGYWTEEDIRDYLAGRLSEREPSAELTASIHRRTSGNPLFVTCLVDELVRSGSTAPDPEAIRAIVPTTLQTMFEHQADQLTEVERDVVDTAAVEGELFSTATVAAALARDQAEVEALCEGLVKRQVVLQRADQVRFPDGAHSPRYSFRHVLCRDALYRRLPPGRQSRLHAALGNAAEALYASDPSRVSAELAGHFELAGVYPKAIEYLRLAADAAASRFANQEAAGHIERALDLIERAGDGAQAAIRMDLLEQRALMRLSTLDLEGSAADFAAVATQAELAGDVNRQVKSLLDCVMPWAFLDARRGLAAVERACLLKPGADPVLAALVDTYRAGAWVYFDGWSRDLEELLNQALVILRSVSDPAFRSRFLWMEAFMRSAASDFAACCRAAEESRQHARRIGIFHQYFVATHLFIMGLIYRGKLGEAMRAARQDAGMAATNHLLLEQLWLESLQACVSIEAFDFAGALPLCERIVNESIMMRFQLTPHVLLWLGLARLGVGDFGGATEALDRLESALEAGGLGFEYRFPMLQGKASCALGLGNIGLAKSLAVRSIRLAEENRAPGHAAKGWRLLSEMASQEGDRAGAIEHILAAIAAVDGCEILNVEWQVYATASRAFAALDRHAESEQARAHALKVADGVAATLADEPALRQSLLARVAASTDVDREEEHRKAMRTFL